MVLIRVFSAVDIGLGLIATPLSLAHELTHFAPFVTMFLGFLRPTLRVPGVIPMVLDHFRDLFVGLSHDAVDGFGCETPGEDATTPVYCPGRAPSSPRRL